VLTAVSRTPVREAFLRLQAEDLPTLARVAAAVATLRGVLERQRRDAEREDVQAVAESDEAVHRTIVSAGGDAVSMRFPVGRADRRRTLSVHALGPVPEQLPLVVAYLDGTHRR
jgi:DNA-binding GntR family transcriptional regulator